MTGLRVLFLLVATLGTGAVGRAAPPPASGSANPTPPGSAPVAATPDAEAQARAAFKRGADHYRAGRYRDAIAAFEEADRLKPSPALHFNVGQAWEKLGDVPAALASYARYLRLDPKAANREAVERTVRSLETRLAATGRQMLHVTTLPADADVSVDGGASARAPVDAAFAPGRHAVAAAAPGHRPATIDVELPRDRSVAVQIALEPAQQPAPVAGALAATPPAPPLDATRPAPAPKPVEEKSWLGPIIAGSLGVVAAGAGVVLGVQARNAQNQLLAGGNDRQQADALVTRAKNDAAAANVLYGVAGAAVLTGGVLAIAF